MHAAIVFVSLLAAAALVRIDFFEIVYRYSRTHESWQIDEIVSIFIVAAFALAAILGLHARRLRCEVRQRKSAESMAREVARYDSLTGIANRHQFQDQLAGALADARAQRRKLAVFVIDIDNFIAVNEAFGHGGGDAVLRRIAERLQGGLRKGDLPARFGADEFVLLHQVAEGEGEDVFRLATRILTVTQEPIPVPGGTANVTVSIGIAKYPRDGEDGGALLQCAQAAMHQAKAAGKNRCQLYDGALDQRRRDRLELEAELREGLRRGEVVAFYQPLMDLATLEPVGFEALARWNHLTRGLLGADAFVPLAEDAGLMDELLVAMVSRVCVDTRGWDCDLSVAVNISPPQLVDPGLARQILDIATAHGTPPHRLEVEITETALLLDFDAGRRSMEHLKAAGLRMSLDDFGTGYSSLRHLYELPFDKIKIDRSFICRLGDDPQCRNIVASMLRLGEELGLTTVAEGVEDQAELDWLRAHGCRLAQGYLFARPLSAADAGRFAAQYRRLVS